MDLELVIGIVGLAVSVIGIPLAFVLARKSRHRPELRFLSDSDVLLAPDEGVPRQSLSVTYSGRPVDLVSRTIIAFWNDRGDTVHGSDIVAADCLRIVVPDGDTVLQAQPLACSRTPCGFALSVAADASSVGLDFEFMDPGDGIVIEVIHAGREPASLLGTVKGATVENRGTAGLSPTYLDMVGQTRRERWRARRQHDLSIGRRWWRMAPSLAGLAMVVAFALRDAYRNKTAKLIPTEGYDLTTIEGQARFAAKVSDEGGHPSDSCSLSSSSDSWR